MPNSSIIDEIRQAIESLDYGSVEVIVQNGEITQISTRIIKKTNAITIEKVSKTTVRKDNQSNLNVNFKY